MPVSARRCAGPALRWMGSLLLSLGILWALLLAAGSAWAHAALVASAPSAGTVLAEPPAVVVLDFSEPVTVTSLRLIGPDAATTVLPADFLPARRIGVSLPPLSVHGTHLLAWRVVSADGHPVAGTLDFAWGVASATPVVAGAVGGSTRAVLIWLVRWLTWLCVFGSVGVLLFRVVAPRERGQWTAGLLSAGCILLPVGLLLQGLDLLDAPWAGAFSARVWAAALASSYALTLGLFAFALAACGLALGLQRTVARAALAGLALLIAGVAAAISGHAATAMPQWLARPVVALHVMMALAWVGCLPPLARLLARSAGAGGRLDALAAFSGWIVSVVVLLVASGVVLVCLQLRAPADLWQTAYGRVLAVKLLLVLLLLALAGVNRWRHTRPALAGDARMRRRLARTTWAEAVVALLVLATLSLWRFTPPPRSLAVAHAAQPAPLFVLRAANAMARVEELRRGRWRVALRQPGGAPLVAQGVTLVLANPAVGVEELRGSGTRGADGGDWIVRMPPLPLTDGWQVRLDVLVDDFDQISLQGGAPQGSLAVPARGDAHGHAGNIPSVQEEIARARVATRISAGDCWIRLLPPAVPSAAYFVLRNGGTAPAVLRAVAAPAWASAMLHHSEEEAGVNRMAMANDITVAAGAMLALHPGGYHVMLEQPREPLAVGGSTTLVLLFDGSRKLPLTCALRAPGVATRSPSG